MPVDILEMQQWSEDRLKAEIQALLPDDLILSYTWVEADRYWKVEYLRVSEGAEEGEGTPIWTSGHFDRHQALFDAFGYLWSQKNQPSVVWQGPSQRPTIASVTQHISEKYADPEDLDPEEIASVYGRSTKPKMGD